MEMQDKEFDELFRSKLNNIEAEPTAQVWDGIAGSLRGRRRYRTLIPYLSIAASIIVLAAAGILFIPKKGAVVKKHPDTGNMAKVVPPVTAPAANNVKPDTLKTRQPTDMPVN